MKKTEPTPLAAQEGALTQIRRKIRSSVRLSGCVRILIGTALPVLPILFLVGLVALGVDQWPLSRLLVKWTFGMLALLALVAGGVAVIQGLIEVVTGVSFDRISARWDGLGKWRKLVVGLAIYLFVLITVLWLLARWSVL